MSLATIVYNATPTTLDSLEIDCTVSEVHQADVEITEHPVEDSVAVADHIRPKQEMVTIEGIITGTPIPSSKQTRNVSTKSPKGKTFNFTTSVPESIANGAITRIESARDTLYRIKNGGQLVTIVTGVKAYESMALKSLTIRRDARTGVSLQFTAVFVQVQTVELKTTRLNESVSTPKAKTKVNDGRKATAETDVDPLRKIGELVGTGAGQTAQAFGILQ